MFNMFILAILDLVNQQARILRRVAMNHALTASLANLLLGLIIFFVLADVDAGIGWVGYDSLVIIIIYVAGVRFIQVQGGRPPSDLPAEEAQIPSLRRAVVGFSVAAAVLVLITPALINSADQIAETTGLGTGFIGATLLAITTSLPELVATIAAVRIGAFDLAVGNLFGSNIFNMFAIGLTDVFYLKGQFISAIDPAFALVGLIALALTSLGLIGNLARVERRLLFVEVDALLILIGYFLGMWFLYTRGIGV
jgi:cation:H+ antiporter